MKYRLFRPSSNRRMTVNFRVSVLSALVLMLSLPMVGVTPWAAGTKNPVARAPVSVEQIDSDSSASASPAPDSTHSDSTLADSSAPTSLTLDYAGVERRAQEVDPMLREKRMEIDKAEQKMRELEMSAILPKFTVETGMGPAPGL